MKMNGNSVTTAKKKHTAQMQTSQKKIVRL